MSRNYEFIQAGMTPDGMPIGSPIKAWIKGVEFDDNTREQVKKAALLPFVDGVALMPDAHLGIGATVGSVIATRGAIIPAAVGVDIGCGMVALRTSLTANQLPDSLSAMRSRIESHVPHGGGRDSGGYWEKQPAYIRETYAESTMFKRLKAICAKHDVLRNEPNRSVPQMATLGGGNHFIEICLDTEDRVWIMLHSGSRGIGNKIGRYFIELAKEDMRKWFILNLPDQDLSYFPEGTEHFDDYVEAVLWAQDFARLNRVLMMEQVKTALAHSVGIEFDAEVEAINCHHNYVEMEHHHGKNLWVTRKGAVRARVGDMGIIPGSMGTRSYIVRGKGNADSYDSCSHGAGRRMARGVAKRTITLERHIEATAGIECRKDADVIDESPDAYKGIDAVMAAQTDLVEVVYELRQIVNVKG